MDKAFVAKATVLINAPAARIWHALIDPHIIKQYMFGTTVTSDWKEGSPIAWKGEWQGRPYEDKGMILRLEPERLVQYSHFSPLSGLPDAPESYHTVTIEVAPERAGTRVLLTQDNNATDKSREHSEENWQKMLTALKTLLEK